jgi:hypothetical protein
MSKSRHKNSGAIPNRLAKVYLRFQLSEHKLKLATDSARFGSLREFG